MTLLLWTTAGLILWIVLWAIGAKGFDAFMLAVVFMLIGATLRIVSRYTPKIRR